jgi:hypothetical protein
MRHVALENMDRETNAIRRGENYDEIAPRSGLMREHKDELPADWF